MKKEEILQRLKEFADYEEDWHYGESEKIQPEAIVKAIQFLELIDYVGEPKVFPMLDGGIQVNFDADNGEIEVEIYKDRVEFLVVEDAIDEYWTQEELDKAKEKAPEYMKVWGVGYENIKLPSIL